MYANLIVDLRDVSSRTSSRPSEELDAAIASGRDVQREVERTAAGLEAIKVGEGVAGDRQGVTLLVVNGFRYAVSNWSYGPRSDPPPPHTPQARLPNYVTMDKLSSIFAAREDMARAMSKLEQVFSSGTIDKEVRQAGFGTLCRLQL